MLSNILLYTIFLSQIFIISFYFPRKMLKRMAYIFETYPPSDFPKLYPKPIHFYQKTHRNYRNMNLAIFLIGLLLLVILINDSTNDDWSGVFNAYFMVQFLPMIVLEIGSFKLYKLMRQANTHSTRKAELRPRRLLDFISPALLGTAFFVYVAFIFFVLYVKQFNFPWFGEYTNIITVTAMNLFFAGIIFWNIYGKKLDPHQAHEDRMRQIELVVKQLTLISTGATLFIMITITLASLDLRQLQPFSMSLYLQIIAVIGLRTLRVDDTNFAVYKKETSVKKGKKELQFDA